MYKMASRHNMGSNKLTNRPTCGGDKKAGLVPHGCNSWSHRAYSGGNNTLLRLWGGESTKRIATCADWHAAKWVTMNPTQSINAVPNAAKHQSARIGMPSV